MQSLSELIDETPPDRLRDNASPAEKMLRASATETEAPPTQPPRRLAPSVQDALEAAEHGDARALAASPHRTAPANGAGLSSFGAGSAPAASNNSTQRAKPPGASGSGLRL